MTKDKSILIKNIYYMLSYAFVPLNQSNYEDIAKEDYDNIHNLFAAILAKGIGKQLKQGLSKEYINRNEDLITLRGKIDISGTIKNKIMKKQSISCEYDELSENNLLNQILKSTSLILIQHANVKTERKDELKRNMLFFSNVDTLNLRSVKWNSIRFSRNNQTYRMLLSICQLIVEGLLLTTEKGEYKMASFLDDINMNKLYEKFVLEYYSKEFPHLNAKSSIIPWALDDDLGTFLPNMITDITLSNKDKMLIIDTKYYSNTMQYNFGTEKLHSSNLYQIFTYIKNAELDKKNSGKKVSGMLLYAKTNETIQPNDEYSVSGNKMAVKTLDLNQDFKGIQNQLNEIANYYFT